MKNFNFNRLTALAVSVAFLFTSLSPQNAFSAVESDIPVIQSIKNAIPKSAGYVSDYRLSAGNKFLVFIQDLHCNPEVQKNISLIISSLDEKVGIDKVILEGVPEGNVKNNAFLSLPDNLKYKVVENLLNEGFLSGVELYSVENNKNNIFGVENWQLYINNLYRASDLLQRKDFILKDIAPFRKAVAKKSSKSKIGYLSNLASGERSDQWYSDLNKASVNFVKPFYEYPELGRYLNLKNVSKKINIKNVTAELEKYLNELKNTLPYKDYLELTDKHDKQNEYFPALYKTAVRGDFTSFLSKYPNLYLFLAYSHQSDKITPLTVYENEEAYVEAILEEAFQNNELSDIILISKMTHLLSSFFAAEMTENEFLFFSANLDAYEYAVENLFPQFSQQLFSYINDSEYYAYYSTNLERNSYFIDNINKYSTDGKINVLVSGGFHSSLVKELAENGISYVVVSPVVKSHANNDVYNKLISINNLNNTSLSGKLKANALNPIPLMLLADGRIPEANREAYLQKLIEMILDPQINADVMIDYEQNTVSISPESLKKILDQWLSGMPDSGYSVSFNANMLNITLQNAELSYPVKNGQIIFSKQSVTTPENFFILSYNAAISRIKEIFLESYPSMIDYILPRNHAVFMQMRKEFYGAPRYAVSMNDTYTAFLNYLVQNDPSINLKVYMRDLVEKQIAEKIDIPIGERTITFVAPAGILKKYNIGQEQLIELIHRALINSGGNINGLPEIIAIAKYEKSETLFLNQFFGKGIIGFNEALLEVEDQNLVANMLQVGILHELKHEFAGKLEAKALDDFEEETNLEDVGEIINRTSADKPEMAIEEVQNHIVMHLGQILHNVNEKSKSRSAKFIRKVQNYKLTIEQIIEMLRKKDLKDADLRHIVSSRMEQTEEKDAIAALEMEISKKEHALQNFKKSLELRDRELSYSTNAAVRRALSEDKAKIKEAFRETKKSLNTAKQLLRKTKSEYASKEDEFVNNQKAIFSGIANYGDSRDSFEKYMQETHGEIEKSGVLDDKSREDIETQFNTLKSNFKELCVSSRMSEDEINIAIQLFDDSFHSGIKLLYNSLPEHLFRRYYIETGMIANHALSHSIAVLSQAIRIMQEDGSLLLELKGGKIDIPVLVYGALMHDLSTLVSRDNHEKNSVYMIESIFKNFEKNENGDAFININLGTGSDRASSDALSINIEKLIAVCEGHKKIKPHSPIKKYHDFTEAQLIHDSDGFSAVFDLDRILDTWINEGTPIFDSSLSIADRVEFILNNRFKGADAVNDLIRQGFTRKQGALYLTAGAIEIIRTEVLAAENTLIEFIDNQSNVIMERRKVKEGIESLNYSKEDIRQMKLAISETIQALRDINEGKLTLESLRNAGNRPTAMRKRYDPVKAKNMIEEKKGPTIAVISDIHASSKIKDFLKKMLAIDAPIEEITPEKIKKALIDSDIERVYVLGDLFDRGDDAYEVFLYAEAIMESGKGFYIMGNHDLWARMNLEGVHLPSYEGFNGIDDDYTVTIGDGDEAEHIDVATYLKTKIDFEKNLLRETGSRLEKTFSNNRKTRIKISEKAEKGKIRTLDTLNMKGSKTISKPEGIMTQRYWAEKFAEYVTYAETQEGKWLESKNTAVQLFNELYGAKLDMEKGKDVLNFPDEYPPGNTELLADAELMKWWKAILGHNVGTTIFRGLTDVNKMSLKWWVDKRNELKTIAETYTQHSAQWETMFSILDAIIEDQQKKLNDEFQKGNWAWMVVDAIMYRNFESPHYYAMDWIFHKGWGDLKDGLLKSVNSTRDESDKLNYVNYLDDPFMIRVRDFFRKHSNLYDIDEYGHFYTHVLPPINENGQISIGQLDETGRAIPIDNGINYKGQHYEGEAIKIALDKISDDLKDESLSLADRLPAYSLLNFMYADETSSLKPEDMVSSIAMVGKRLQEEKAAKFIHGKMTYKSISAEEILKAFRSINDLYSGETDKVSPDAIKNVDNLLEHANNIMESFWQTTIAERSQNQELVDIIKALEILFSYAETGTTQDKLQVLANEGKKRVNIGLARREIYISVALYDVMDTLETVALFMGHNPNDKMRQQKFDSIIKNRYGGQLLVLTDYGISKKYGDLGGFLILNPLMGIVKIGFERIGDKGVKQLLTQNFVSSQSFARRIHHTADLTMRKSEIFTTKNAEIIDIMINNDSNLRYAQAGIFSKFGIKSKVFEIAQNAEDFPVDFEEHTSIDVIVSGLLITVEAYLSVSSEGYETIKIFFPEKAQETMKKLAELYDENTTEIVLSKIVHENYLLPSRTKVIVRTGNDEHFRAFSAANESTMRYVAFITDIKDSGENLFNRKRLGDNIHSAILKAYSKAVNFDILPPAIAVEQLLESGREKISAPFSIEAILAAA